MTLRRPLVRIGYEFTDPATGWRWRVTDVGTRTFLAINTTESTLATSTSDGKQDTRIVDPKAEGLLNGPPYAVAEHVWDEYAVEALTDVKGLEWEHTRPVEDRRVLEAAAKLSILALQDLGMQGFQTMDTEDGRALYAFVAFEVARRIVEADPDLPRHKTTAEVIEAPLQRLFVELEDAIKEGEKSKTLTSEERLERSWTFASTTRKNRAKKSHD